MSNLFYNNVLRVVSYGSPRGVKIHLSLTQGIYFDRFEGASTIFSATLRACVLLVKLNTFGFTCDFILSTSPSLITFLLLSFPNVHHLFFSFDPESCLVSLWSEMSPFLTSTSSIF